MVKLRERKQIAVWGEVLRWNHVLWVLVWHGIRRKLKLIKFLGPWDNFKHFHYFLDVAKSRIHRKSERSKSHLHRFIISTQSRLRPTSNSITFIVTSFMPSRPRKTWRKLFRSRRRMEVRSRANYRHHYQADSGARRLDTKAEFPLMASELFKDFQHIDSH